MEEARRDPKLAERTDVMSLLVQATHEDGTSMSDEEVRDQLMTMMIAGHETTAATLSWAVERLSRNPRGARQVDRVRARRRDRLSRTSSSTRRCASARRFRWPCAACRRSRTSSAATACRSRRASAQTRHSSHFDPNLFENPREFRPERFLEERPSNYAYIPFGGGVRRCIGAAFARMEFNAVMERMLDRFDLAADRREVRTVGLPQHHVRAGQRRPRHVHAPGSRS